MAWLSGSTTRTVQDVAQDIQSVGRRTFLVIPQSQPPNKPAERLVQHSQPASSRMLVPNVRANLVR